MQTDIVVFWFLVLTCLAGLVTVIVRLRSAALGWGVLYFIILSTALIGWLSEKNGLVYAGMAMWFLLVLLPGLLSRIYHRDFLQQRYAAAHRMAKIIRVLHPADGWIQQPEIVRALGLAHAGDFPAATQILRRFKSAKSSIGVAAIANLYRLANQWEEFLVWQKQFPADLERRTQLLPLLLRAHGEIGDVRGLAEEYDRNKLRIARLVPATSRDLCRLVLFAFSGNREAVAKLLDGSLSILPDSIRGFWLANANLASGATDLAKRQFEDLLTVADPTLRRAIEWRLLRISLAPPLPDELVYRVNEEALREYVYDEHFGARRPLLSKHARATQVLIGLNVLAFIIEILSGGGSNAENLYRLGAMFPPAVQSGEWWRLIASLFLHFGPLHLGMNMFALAVLGPFAEFALGFYRFLFVFLLAGIGSMATVMLFANEQLTVGASGCIMGLVGATGTLMLRGWLRERASAARRRLVAVLAIVTMQTVFDSLVPQVSMTAHLSGAVIGFLGALLLRDRLKGPA